MVFMIIKKESLEFLAAWGTITEDDYIMGVKESKLYERIYKKVKRENERKMKKNMKRGKK